MMLAARYAGAAGLQYAAAPDPDGQPIELAIWYPSEAKATSQPIGLFTQEVAFYGPIKGSALPLVIVSHGTGGSAAGHYDTALALAEAGFVVVALNHTGDNYKDRAYSFTPRNFVDRAKHIGRVVDFMLGAWDGHDRLDPERIGIFGHSAGAATALIAIGGEPDLAAAAAFCRADPDFWSCRRRRERNTADPPKAADADPPAWRHEPRIKTAAVTAPALGPSFTKEALASVTAPVQLWAAADDRITPNASFADAVKANLPRPPDYRLVANAGHFDFLAPCNEALAKVAPEICVSAPGFDRAAFHDNDMNQALVAFFRAQLPPPP
jgi:predicted dienelactone hydrolase